MELVEGLLWIEEAIADKGVFVPRGEDQGGEACMMISPASNFVPETVFPPWQPWVSGTMGGLVLFTLLWICMCSSRVQRQARKSMAMRRTVQEAIRVSQCASGIRSGLGGAGMVHLESERDQRLMWQG